MTLPAWYTDFWCPADMREIDPFGCGMGLGMGLFLLFVGAVAVVLGVVTAVVYFWPTDKKEKESP